MKTAIIINLDDLQQWMRWYLDELNLSDDLLPRLTLSGFLYYIHTHLEKEQRDGQSKDNSTSSRFEAGGSTQ